MTDNKLCAIATEQMKNSYSPYSFFTVGAALLCDDGSVYTGCNIENSAFTPTVCAERTAFFKAVSEGKRNFKKIAIAGGKNATVTKACAPCGVCRQVMSEFCSKDFEILLVTPNGFEKHTLFKLLPLSFELEK